MGIYEKLRTSRFQILRFGSNLSNTLAVKYEKAEPFLHQKGLPNLEAQKTNFPGSHIHKMGIYEKLRTCKFQILKFGSNIWKHPGCKLWKTGPDVCHFYISNNKVNINAWAFGFIVICS